MKHFLFIFLFFYFKSNGQKISGKVVDKFLATNISLANVQLISSDGGQNVTVFTDSLGFFQFNNLSLGRYSITVTHIAFEKQNLYDVLIIGNNNPFFEILLNSRNYNLKDTFVTVKSSETPSNIKLNIEKSSRYAATWGDPARMALSFAGITSNNDKSNEIIIRGNSPKGILWKLENIEIPNPNHFSEDGSSGGSVGAITAYTMSNSNLYTSAFPSYIGNATSGVMDIKLRQGDKNDFKHRLNIGILGAEISSEGPLNNGKGSYLLNYRFVNTFLVKSLGLVNLLNTVNPLFQDGLMKIVYLKRRSVISLWSIFGYNMSYFEIKDFKTVDSNGSFSSSGLKIHSEINELCSWENHLSFSYSSLSTSEKDLTEIKNDRLFNIKYPVVRLSSELNFQLKKNLKNKIGFIFHNMYYNTLGKTSYEYPGIPFFSDLTLNDKGNSFFVQTFFNNHFNISKLDVDLGLHYSLFLLNNTNSLEPRVNLKYPYHNSIFEVGLGKHSRIEPINVYLFKKDQIFNGIKLNNVDLEMPKAWHFNLAYQYNFQNMANFKIELYYQKLFDFAIADRKYNLNSNVSYINVLNAFNLIPLKSDGKGKNYGIEFTYETKIVRGNYLISTLSLYNSLYDFYEKVNLPTRFGNNFILNSTAGKEWKFKKMLVNSSLKNTFIKGNRIQPYTINNNSLIYDTSIGYTKRLADYYKLDLKINIYKQFNKSTISYTLDINNLTNRKNQYLIFYNPILKKIEYINQMGILPIFNITYSFM